MPIGVPRIIYCWGEEVPAQWTDIYNFIFRRRMVFLMQYLDDELCNQICGLLINIHMEDRATELENKEEIQNQKQKRERSFKTTLKGQEKETNPRDILAETSTKKMGPSFEDLLAADEDLGIEENNTLEEYTLQKITMEWLNWNAQFFDYSNEPYLFYLAEMVSKDFNQGEGRMLSSGDNKEMSILMSLLKNRMNQKKSITSGFRLSSDSPSSLSERSAVGTKKGRKALTRSEEGASSSSLMKFFDKFSYGAGNQRTSGLPGGGSFVSEGTNLNNKKNHLDVYSPFRLLANFAAQDYNLKDVNPLIYSELSNTSVSELNFYPEGENFPSSEGAASQDFPLPAVGNNFKTKLLELFNNTLRNKANQNFDNNSNSKGMSKLLTELSQRKFLSKTKAPKALLKSSEKALSQRLLKKEYTQDINYLSQTATNSSKLNTNEGKLPAANYLDFYSYNESYNEFNKKAPRSKEFQEMMQEQESKKVYVLINSFGGSVGNGITVHDALQFIKAGSFTLGLGVAASAASLALAGGTIGERYVTEGCHVMIHQPEGGIQGQASDIWIDSQEIMKIRKDVAEIYSLATYRPRHKILRDLDRDFYLTAPETVQYGLADEIATNGVMQEIIEMTSKVWDYHDTKQQRLLESRENISSGFDTQAQN
jgi:ATP-dependent Clp protease protease subunit